MTLGTVPQDKPAIYGFRDTNPIASLFSGSEGAGMHIRNELRGFWDSVLIKSIVYPTGQEGTDDSRYYTPSTGFFVDKVISPGYFKDHYLDTFRSFVYVPKHCELYFSVFLLVKLNIDALVMILRYMEKNKETGSTLRFGKLFLRAYYNIFSTIILTSLLAAIEHTEVSFCVKNVTHKVKEDVKKKEKHLYLQSTR